MYVHLHVDACELVCASMWRWDQPQVVFVVTCELSLLCFESGSLAVTQD